METLKNELEKLNEQVKYSNQLKYQLLMSNIISNLEFKDIKDKEILLLLLQDRDRNYVRINNNQQCYENIKRYLSILRPLKLPLQDLVRIGGESDGGYVMMSMKNMGGGKAISLGVSEYSPWDLEMADLGFEVVEYDGSIEKCPYKHKNITFHKKFVSGKVCDTNHITLEQIIIENNMDVKASNILQCDIENFEWEVLENTDMSILDKYFSQIIFEFHGCNPEELEGALRRFLVLEKISEYYIPINIHLNNHGKIFYSNGLFFSTTVEVSYLRKDLVQRYFSYVEYEQDVCANKLSTKKGKIKMNNSSLNYPTFLPNPEIPIKFSFNKDDYEQSL